MDFMIVKFIEVLLSIFAKVWHSLNFVLIATNLGFPG